jgi:hypothetical protein
VLTLLHVGPSQKQEDKGQHAEVHTAHLPPECRRCSLAHRT